MSLINSPPLKKALAIDPKHTAALFIMGSVLESLGYHHQSLSYFKEALSLPQPLHQSPTQQLFRLTERAIALTHLGNYSRARDIANNILKGDPTNLYALNIKGVALLYLKNATGALTIFNKILTEYPNLTAAIDNKAIALAGLGENTQALKLFDMSISLNPNDADAWYDVGDILDHMGNFRGALTAYNHALQLTPHNQDLLWNRNLTLGAISYQSGNYSDAVKVYDAMLKVEPQNSYLQQALELALDWQKGLQSLSSSPSPANYTGARDYFNKIISITPSDSEALNNEGLALAHLNDRRAIQFFERSLVLDPSNYVILWNKGYSELIWHNYNEAAPIFAKILKLNQTDSAAALDDLGLALFSLGNRTAIKYFDNVVRRL